MPRSGWNPLSWFFRQRPDAGASPGARTEAPGFALVDAGYPIPGESIVSPVVSAGAVLRTARWMPRDGFDGRPARAETSRGTVLICTGRSEFVEKYFDVVEELQTRGFAVVVFDWRGQGLSDRSLRNRQKGHVVHFRDYVRDLESVVAQVVEPFCPKPWFCLAHSMGGAIAMTYAADHPKRFDRLVLSAPMIEIARLSFPQTARATAQCLRLGGLGPRFAPGERRRMTWYGAFERNLLTSDAARYQKCVDYLEAEPRLSVGAPTIGWVHAAFTAMARLHDDSFPLRFSTPTLVVNPGADRVVEPRATERLMSRLRATSVVTVPHCRHEILMESDVFRQQFWSAFDAFVPGLR